MIRFRTTIELGGKTATGFQVPDAVIAELAGGKKPRVHVRLGGHRYRSTVAVYGGRFMIPLSAENRTAAAVAAGDEVEVGLELDTEERTVAVPEDLAAALEAAGLRDAFDGLSFSRRRERAGSVETAKQEQTRQRRVQKIVDELSP